MVNKNCGVSKKVSSNTISDKVDEKYDNAKSGKGLSFISATVFIIGEVAGGGLLTLPKATQGIGWAGVVVLIICCLNAGVSGVYLAKCWLILEERWPKYRTGLTRTPFATIGQRAYGNWMRVVVSISMNVTRFGSSTVFLLLTSSLIKSVTNSFIPSFSFCYWLPIVGTALTPLMWLGSPADFWPAAYSAMFATLIGSVLLLINIIRDSPDYIEKASYSAPTFKSFFLSFGKLLFAYGGASAFPNFQNDMKEKDKFPKAVTIGFTGLIFIYLPVSVAGYAVYGDGVQTNILESMSESWLSTVIKACFALHCFFAFLIIINPVVLEMEELLKIPERFGLKRILFRTLLMVALVFSGETVPQFDKIVDLIGGSTMTLMVFVMPPAFYIKLCSDKSLNWPQRKVSKFLKIFLMQIAIVGIFGGIAATYSAIENWVSDSKMQSPCYVKIPDDYRISPNMTR